ncbi:hypothetical protein [Deinococcus cellulosilyticus]|uniref:Uncharacterized protein n=1 Tax=Deinococcus cellulosilyticus (strain DSM 18568 / NBRC 106333 / KACC 11606 / 5516J-15) TaxID=1223518 RepID=A0A511N3X0_DEIC1|nr:hypothetical protein [Deinococcus cellulosilyticus]GEM47187.1 hypothetical protein DC3_28220 [Deinococcus cellulosilyticus NBRC 106333 = KACC 11606]
MSLQGILSKAIKDARSTGYTQQVNLQNGLKIRVRVQATLLQFCLYRKDQNPSELEGKTVAKHAGLAEGTYSLSWSHSNDGKRQFLVIDQTMPGLVQP